MSTGRDTLVVALGGNAIQQPAQKGTFEEQLVAVDGACRRLARLIGRGHRVIVTHGNGPQIGNLIAQNEASAGLIPAMPMDVCGAETQGQIGLMIQQCLANHLERNGWSDGVCTVLTETEVDGDDPAFAAPSKPVGRFYTAEQAAELALECGYVMREDAGRGWRRVVPSPEPRRLVQADVIGRLVRNGVTVVCAGGGGVPVVRDASGAYHGVEAVVDKDLAAAVLAVDVGADTLVILTDVDHVYLRYGQAGQQALRMVDRPELARHVANGHFSAGSMGPKVEAALRFAQAGGSVVIARLDDVEAALRGEAGTRVVPDPEPAADRGPVRRLTSVDAVAEARAVHTWPARQWQPAPRIATAASCARGG